MREAEHQIQRIEELIRRVETIADPEVRASVVELVQSLMELHGEGLDRVMEIVSQEGEAGRTITQEFAQDGLISGLLLLYGLHPVSLETRVMQALDKVRPYLKSHGGNVEVLGLDDGVVRLRLEGSCKTCPSSVMTLKLAIEEAIYEAAPDVIAIEAEGIVEPPPSTGFIQLGRTRSETEHPGKGNGWKEVDGLATLTQGAVRTVEVGGRLVLFCRLDETFYAYNSNCPGCSNTLQAAYLEAAALVCPACGQRYDVMKAGRALSQPDLYLEPFPLLKERGQVKVALPHNR
ncbi:MAG: NifU family protein [Pyrinomonadaceae bacterium]